MTVHLLNSAMMPQPGIYHCRKISDVDFFGAIVDAYHSGNLKTYIAYPQNRDYIKQCTGITLLLNREETHIEHGDQLLVMKLRYRTDQPKGAAVTPDDFEFYFITYQQ